jgi:UDP-glucose 4-epimerase
LKKIKNILVTGGAGFIGSHTVVQLLHSGFQVIIADDLSNSREEVIGSIEKITGKRPEFIKVDLCDKVKTGELFDKFSIDAVIHFAAKKLVGESVEQPLDYYHTNLESLMNVIRECIRTGVKDIVFSSSCSVYGQPEQLPVSESADLMPAESPYGNTKKVSEDILRDVSRAEPLNVIALRYFNPAGAHSSGLIGEYPLNQPTNLMPVITQVAAGKRSKLQVFGSDYDTPDGTCIRDYIHVVDLADAHVSALNYLDERKDENTSCFETFNVGTGTGVSVLEIISAFEKVNGVKLNYEIAARRSGDVEKVYGDTSRINKIMGWKAKLGVDEMVRSAWAWECALSEKIDL